MPLNGGLAEPHIFDWPKTEKQNISQGLIIYKHWYLALQSPNTLLHAQRHFVAAKLHLQRNCNKKKLVKCDLSNRQPKKKKNENIACSV